MKTTAPDHKTYNVTRRWMLWRRKFRASNRHDDSNVPLTDTSSGSFGDWGDDLGALALIGVAVLLAILIPSGLIFVGIAIELVLLLALLPIAVLARVVFGMSWEVEVRDVNGGIVWPVIHVETVKGWSDSGQRIAELSEEIRLGQFTPNLTAQENP